MSKQTNSEQITEDVFLFRQKFLGRGSFGEVYKGIIKSQSKIIAIKQIRYRDPQKIKKNVQLWFFQSVKAKHPNILEYFGSTINNQSLYIFIELCKGGTLTQQIRKNRPTNNNKISQLKVLLLFQQLLQGMVFLNKHKIIHRDLKPDNILLDDMGVLKIGDFGTAKQDIDIMITSKSNFTPLYCAPQVLLDEQDSYSSNRDVWSAGLILYQMLMGKPLFNMYNDIQSLKRGLEQFRKKNRVIENIPNLFQQWIEIINSMLVFDYRKRPHFSTILDNFKQQRKVLLKKIYVKYKIQQTNLSNTMVSNPYSTHRSNDSTFRGFNQQFRQQISRDLVIDLRSYMNFFYQKNQTMFLQFSAAVTKSSISNFLNIFKYCLILIAWSIYYKRLGRTIEQIRKFRIQLPENRIIEKKDFVNWHQTQVQIILTEFKQRFQTKKTQILELIKKQILPAILTRIQQKQSNRIALNQKILSKIPNFVDLVRNCSQKIDKTEDYLNIFIKLSSCSKIYVRTNDWEGLNEDDKRIYLKMRTICCIDQIFPDTLFRDQDFIFSMQQAIENFTKQESLQFLQKYNQRYQF